MLTSIILAGVIAFITPFAAFAASASINEGNRRRSNNRLKAAPLVHIGAKYDKIHIEGVEAPLIGVCTLTCLEVGRVEVTDSEGRKMSFTGQEFEKLHPVYSAEQNHNGL